MDYNFESDETDPKIIMTTMIQVEQEEEEPQAQKRLMWWLVMHKVW